jgi:sterol 3beta-glucosyltransferase
MRILILTVGSRGDVQPYVALGKGLVAAGHDVTLCTSESFQPFVEEHGLTYEYMNDGFVQFMGTDLSREAMEQMSSLRGLIRYAPSLWQQSQALQRDLNRDAWNAAQSVQPDLILYHPKMYIAPHIAERLRVPAMLPFVIPMSAPTAAFPSPGLPAVTGLPDSVEAVYNRLTYHLVRRLTHFGTRRFVQDWRMSVGLPRSPKHTGLYQQFDGRPVPILYGFSRHLVPRAPDWPEHVEITGTWELGSETSAVDAWASPELMEFLEAGPAPVYVGFGSMSGRAPDELAETVIQALRVANVRGVLSSGWGGLQAGEVPDFATVVGSIPHDNLFPRMSAVVHHGGAGTTAAGLRAGRPTVICPFIADQPFWGRQVHERGAGPAPIRQPELTVSSLARAIRQATEDRGMQRAAKRIGRGMRAENGVERAVEIIERRYHSESTGRLV